MCFCRPSSFPRKRGNLNVIGNLRHGRQPESVGMAAQRHVGYEAEVMVVRADLRFHACRSNHATASMWAVCGNRLSMPAARNA